MRIFFAVDVHGSTATWKKWIRAPEFYKADFLMLCGDLTGKAIIPIVDRGDGTYYCFHMGRKWELRSQSEVEKMKERISAAGPYPLVCDKQTIQELQMDQSKVMELMNKLMEERIAEWVDMLLQRVDPNKIGVLMMPGNDDEKVIDPVIKSYESDGIIWPLDKVVEVAGLEMISMEYVNPTPWNTPREASEKELKKMIEEKVNKLSDPQRAIFNFHCPPYNTMLDVCPKLDKNLKPVIAGGEIVTMHAGSKAVRKAIEKYQPVLGLHGHIHESSAAQKLGRTIVVNPGSEYEKGLLRGFIIDISNGVVERYWKVEG
ncbi:MAG: phosphoesterase [Thermoprotei archaeon]|nr:MAG: phosphoesterase [Thermoprotei archaeon]